MPVKKTNTKPKVFINCPFDDEYRPLFRALVFCILYLDRYPIFSENRSSDKIRINEIIKLISESRLGIHDLSRHKAKVAEDLPRFNLPFELGLDIGSKRFGGVKYSKRKILVFDSSPHDYDKFIGDISGQDIESHNNNPETIIIKVRDWLSRIYKHLPGYTKIWKAYIQFSDDLPSRLSNNFTLHEIEVMQIGDYRGFAKDWIHDFKKDTMNR